MQFLSFLPLQVCEGEDPDVRDGVAVGPLCCCCFSAALVVEKLQNFALLLTWCSAEEWTNFPEMARSVRGTYPSCLCSATQNLLYLSFPGVCKELLLDLLSQKLCKWQHFVLQPQKSDYSLDDLLNRALPPCFGCFNGILMNLSHSPQGGNGLFCCYWNKNGKHQVLVSVFKKLDAPVKIDNRMLGGCYPKKHRNH